MAGGSQRSFLTNRTSPPPQTSSTVAPRVISSLAGLALDRSLTGMKRVTAFSRETINIYFPSAISDTSNLPSASVVVSNISRCVSSFGVTLTLARLVTDSLLTNETVPESLGKVFCPITHMSRPSASFPEPKSATTNVNTKIQRMCRTFIITSFLLHASS